MELTFVNTVQSIRGKWETVILHSRLPVLENPDSPIGPCYQKGREGMERYIREKLLPDLEKADARERRHNRLHRREIQCAYICSGELVDGRYLSLKLKCTRFGEREGQESCRVWDVARGCLCPIELFLPRSVAKKYDRWAFALEEERLWAVSPSTGERSWLSRTPPSRRIDRKRIDK